MQPHALTTGPLRDRVFSMADQLGVKLQQVYLIPSGKGQMANAFASSGNNISFTDFLLQRMSQREVDYVRAHELTHLKLQHPSKLAMARVGGHLLGGVLLTAVALVLPSANFTVIRYLLMLAAMTTFPYFISRRFEYAADAGAVAATSDPRSAISALFKLSQLNMLPLHWNKWTKNGSFIHPVSAVPRPSPGKRAYPLSKSPLSPKRALARTPPPMHRRPSQRPATRSIPRSIRKLPSRN